MAAIMNTWKLENALDYTNMNTAKKLAFTVATVLIIIHGTRIYNNGGDTCNNLLSRGHLAADKKWQPEGCMLHKYSKMDMRKCLSEKTFTFVGDSRQRQLYFKLVKSISVSTVKEGKQHEDIVYHEEDTGISVNFLWQPMVNGSMEKVYKEWKEGKKKKPSIIITGSGVWAIKQMNASGKALTEYQANLTLLRPLMEEVAMETDVYWMLQDPVNNTQLSKERKMITNTQVDSYNNVAMEILEGSHVGILQSTHQAASELLHVSADGIHLGEPALDIHLSLLLNLFCNDQLRPIDGSCCQSFHPPSLLQVGTGVFFGLCLVGAMLFSVTRGRSPSMSEDAETAQNQKKTKSSAEIARMTLVALAKFGVIMAYFYLCDRTPLFMRENKHYTHLQFFVPFVWVLLVGLFFHADTKQTSILNRDQTDEWKGWMQLVILIYHYTGTSSYLPIYMHIRILVAMYLFQTGYGHFFYFWNKGDYGIVRLCQVNFRLNFLVVFLCMVMDRPYQFYYFVPLVTFWFFVVYGTMAVLPRVTAKSSGGAANMPEASGCTARLSFNATDNSSGFVLMMFKLLVLCGIIALLASMQVLFESLFSWWPAVQLFQLDGSIREWWFRWQLDRYAVSYGMFFAFTYLGLKKLQIIDDSFHGNLFTPCVTYLIVTLSVCITLGYTVFMTTCSSKVECNRLHPYISFLPITSFILVRNVPGYLRSRYSTFFAWFGKISLELFIGQYHIWLAADTKGILVVIPGYHTLNMLVTFFIFVCVAHEISAVTGTLATTLVPRDFHTVMQRLIMFVLFLCVMLLYGHFGDKIQLF
ncbi:N-acetylneuraminate 9-O-acetyltransferase-like isoform X1 [Branchiostoma lanceolatum]|uniref:N-acetylneuraminate 9-O-acetyltransferase-like isoform X1 n=1 Tax=Branchiostoma lanceolatum TaxID=7740 RepID=UPI003456A725